MTGKLHTNVDNCCWGSCSWGSQRGPTAFFLVRFLYWICCSLSLCLTYTLYCPFSVTNVTSQSGLREKGWIFFHFTYCWILILIHMWINWNEVNLRIATLKSFVILASFAQFYLFHHFSLEGKSFSSNYVELKHIQFFVNFAKSLMFLENQVFSTLLFNLDWFLFKNT